MKSESVITCWTAASTSSAIEACWAFRSTNGSFSATRFLGSPDVGSFEESLETHEVGDVFYPYRRASGDHSADCAVLGHHAARADQRAGADLQAGQDGGVRADA